MFGSKFSQPLQLVNLLCHSMEESMINRRAVLALSAVGGAMAFSGKSSADSCIVIEGAPESGQTNSVDEPGTEGSCDSSGSNLFGPATVQYYNTSGGYTTYGGTVSTVNGSASQAFVEARNSSGGLVGSWTLNSTSSNMSVYNYGSSTSVSGNADWSTCVGTFKRYP